jgi:hypothetical protein
MSSLSKLVFCKAYQSSWKYQVLPIARLALNNNNSLHYLFTKPYFLWFFENFYDIYLLVFENKHVCKLNWPKRPSGVLSFSVRRLLSITFHINI